jgi:hypothetical protein
MWKFHLDCAEERKPAVEEAIHATGNRIRMETRVAENRSCGTPFSLREKWQWEF